MALIFTLLLVLMAAYTSSQPVGDSCNSDEVKTCMEAFGRATDAIQDPMEDAQSKEGYCNAFGVLTSCMDNLENPINPGACASDIYFQTWQQISGVGSWFCPIAQSA